eukprot:CAMPEP_0197011758 /NCGR_PEP_ID=MMETSP1380-20130617/59816_1 /TAXON_ID=5936 /ORGANISM="Euplotes crassus, Strain CT5" /LENGTH=67 /DNA_ID=CAMNT_0042434733 /DNA_START=14 /DNA_END=214 /DNA_ORIENTATION=+
MINGGEDIPYESKPGDMLHAPDSSISKFRQTTSYTKLVQTYITSPSAKKCMKKGCFISLIGGIVIVV